jgi:hypothetical protein
MDRTSGLLEIPSLDDAEPGAGGRDGESEVASSIGPVTVERSEPNGSSSLAFRGLIESPPSPAVSGSLGPPVAGNESAHSQKATQAAPGPILPLAAQPEANNNPAPVLGFFARKLNQQANQHEHQESSATTQSHLAPRGVHFPHGTGPSWKERLASHGHSQKHAVVESAPVAVNFDSAQPDWSQVRLDECTRRGCTACSRGAARHAAEGLHGTRQQASSTLPRQSADGVLRSNWSVIVRLRCNRCAACLGGTRDDANTAQQHAQVLKHLNPKPLPQTPKH